MGNTNIDWLQMSDGAIVRQIGNYIKHERVQQNKTQAQLSEIAGLNRWTISQIEKGEAITLMSLIQILRSLNSLNTLKEFEVLEEISPLAYAKLKKKKRKRVRGKITNTPVKDDWDGRRSRSENMG